MADPLTAVEAQQAAEDVWDGLRYDGTSDCYPGAEPFQKLLDHMAALLTHAETLQRGMEGFHGALMIATEQLVAAEAECVRLQREVEEWKDEARRWQNTSGYLVKAIERMETTGTVVSEGSEGALSPVREPQPGECDACLEPATSSDVDGSWCGKHSGPTTRPGGRCGAGEGGCLFGNCNWPDQPCRANAPDPPTPATRDSGAVQDPDSASVRLRERAGEEKP